MFFEILDICTRVRELHETPNDEDGFINSPTIRALDMFKYVVIRAYTYTKAPIRPLISPDGMGGLKVGWRIEVGNSDIRLYIAPLNSGKDYIYFVKDGEDSIDYEVTHENLLKYFHQV